jgi:hypothetical protein
VPFFFLSFLCYHFLTERIYLWDIEDRKAHSALVVRFIYLERTMMSSCADRGLRASPEGGGNVAGEMNCLYHGRGIHIRCMIPPHNMYNTNTIPIPKHPTESAHSHTSRTNRPTTLSPSPVKIQNSRPP